MKKYIITVACLVLLYIGWDYAHYQLGWYIDFHPHKEVSSFMHIKDEKIYQATSNGDLEFEIRGVDMGSGYPGEWATDFAIDKKTYLRWFELIQEMGANVVRIYTIQSDDFYEAFYEYNKDREKPLYLLHGVWVNDYVLNSHRDAYDKDFYGNLIQDCRSVVDVIHGNKKISLGRMASAGSGYYHRDISQWVIGYILGVEWYDPTVRFTDEMNADIEKYTSYQGKYLYSSPQASPFEVMLTMVGDKMIEYESNKYKQQRLLAFSNWPSTDPFDYPEDVAHFFKKCAKVDVEHIKCSNQFIAGQFASYHIYPYHPDFLNHIQNWDKYGLQRSSFALPNGNVNTYQAYLKMITNYHTIPVVISEFGIPTSRGITHIDTNSGRNQGRMTEKQQGEALKMCWNDIKAAGCNGGCVFSWQDEWFKRTWNVWYGVDLKRTPYWSDYQTNEQSFGILTFDPGIETSVCYVDGDVSEWNPNDVVVKQDNISVSMKYDEKFVYFKVTKDNLDLENEIIYLPIDTTQKSGSSYCENGDLRFDRAVDFLLVLNGRDNSRMLVQERYESLRSTYAQEVYQFDTYIKKNQPDICSPKFVPIYMVMELSQFGTTNEPGVVYETGHLTYGNGNPNCADFNSLADFICDGDNIEIRVPWQLLNFADPSSMEIHDDYYENYGVDYIKIDTMYVGVGTPNSNERIMLSPFKLNGWGNDVTFHERLKSAYYVLKDLWTES